MVSTKSLVRNMGLSLLLVFWCLSINLSPALAADPPSKHSSKAAPHPPPMPKSPKAAGSAPQPRSFGYGGYGGYGGGHDLFDRGFGGEFLPILAVIGFAVIFLPIFGILMASLSQFSAPIGFPLNQAVTTATVAGRRKREANDETLLKLLKGFDKFYKGFAKSQ
ncbi:uncharacterized protein LOC100900054 [Galendromus occidentalis]|uniref:Uncharacterized protein LOC100900054 n=1 Tax=Galendromus occidentalis TaxID=34638 RepID=A0AAJ6QNN4_9ACAR|nr:uncharacterized protein LOC100900054 [Galendromus occidentalis]